MSAINLFWNGVSLYGTYTKWFRVDSDTAPERDVQVIDIPGRSGSLLLDNKRYPNVDMIYDVVFLPAPSNQTSVEARVADIKHRLLMYPGQYIKLTDSTEHSGEFYMARVTGDIVPVFTRNRDMAKMRVTFNRKPQRFYSAGDNWRSYTKTQSYAELWILNVDTDYDTEPLIRVVGYGTLTVNDCTVTIAGTDSSQEIYIDCEAKECYAETNVGVVSKNGSVTLSNNEFPTLQPGNNSIVIGNGIAEVAIKTRAWRL